MGGYWAKTYFSMIAHVLSVAEFNDLCNLGIKDVRGFSISNSRAYGGFEALDSHLPTQVNLLEVIAISILWCTVEPL
jgi:hypothetical protein